MNTLHCEKFWAWFFLRYCGSHLENGQVEILRCWESIQDLIIYLHMKFFWNRTMLDLCGIVVAILKMATGRNCSMSGILEHHNLPKWNVAEIGKCWICVVLWWPFWKWWPLEIFQCRDIIIYPHMKCHWNRTMLNLCGIVVAIFKMASARNCSMSEINSGHHNLPTYQS